MKTRGRGEPDGVLAVRKKKGDRPVVAKRLTKARMKRCPVQRRPETSPPCSPADVSLQSPPAEAPLIGEATPEEDDFDLATRKLHSRLLATGERISVGERLAKALRETFDRLPTYGSCVIKSGDSIGQERTMATDPEYRLAVASDLLGNSCARERHFRDASTCFKMAHVIHVSRFDRKSVKARELQRKMARALLEERRWVDVVRELRPDADVDAHGTPLDEENTLCIRFAFGSALHALGRTHEAIPYLCQPYLGTMNTRKSGNMAVLRCTFRITCDLLCRGLDQPAICLAERLLLAFAPRMRTGTCPHEVFDFATYFCCMLRARGLHDPVHHLYRAVLQLHQGQEGPSHSQVDLLCACVGLSLLPRQQDVHRRCMNLVVTHHARLLHRACTGEHRCVEALAMLQITTKLIYLHAEWDPAIRLLLTTYNQVSDVLDPQDPLHLFFLDMANGRLWSKA